MLGQDKRIQESLEPNYDKLTGLLFWCALIVVSSVYITTPLISVFSQEFTISTTVAAWSSSMFSFFYAIGFLFFGPLSDRIGRKEVLLSGMGALAIVTCLLGFADEFYMIVILRGIQGFVAASFAPTAMAYVFDVFPKNKIGSAIGFISFGYVTAGILGQIFAESIKQTFDWKIIFFSFALFYFLTSLKIYISLPRSSQPTVSTKINDVVKQMKALLLIRNLRITYGITSLLLLTFIGMYTVLGDYLQSTFQDLTEKDILFIRGAGIVAMVFSPITGMMMKKIKPMFMLRVGLIIGVIGLAFLGLEGSILFTTLMSIIYVAGISIIFPAIMMLVGEFGYIYRGLANALYAFILFIGATLGPIVALYLMKWGSYIFTFGMLALLMLGGLILTLLYKRKEV